MLRPFSVLSIAAFCSGLVTAELPLVGKLKQSHCESGSNTRPAFSEITDLLVHPGTTPLAGLASITTLPPDGTTVVSHTTAPAFQFDLVNRALGPDVAHTESSEDILDVPSLTTSTSTSSPQPAIAVATPSTATNKIGQAPQVAHTETSITNLDVPQTTTTIPVLTPTPAPAPPVTSAIDSSPPATTNNEQNDVPGNTVYIPHTEASAAAIQAPTYANTGTTPYAAPTHAYDNNQPSSSVVVFTSNNMVFSSTIIAPTLAPVLYTSASGAVGLVAGSSQVVISGTTYSLAAGGSALWVNGVSTNLKPTHTATWSTSKGVVYSNGAIVSSSIVTATVQTRSVSTSTLKTTTSTKAATSTTSTLPIAASSSPAATGVASLQVAIAWRTISLGLSLSVLSLLLL